MRTAWTIFTLLHGFADKRGDYLPGVEACQQMRGFCGEIGCCVQSCRGFALGTLRHETQTECSFFSLHGREWEQDVLIESPDEVLHAKLGL